MFIRTSAHAHNRRNGYSMAEYGYASWWLHINRPAINLLSYSIYDPHFTTEVREWNRFSSKARNYDGTRYNLFPGHVGGGPALIALSARV